MLNKVILIGSLFFLALSIYGMFSYLWGNSDD